MVSVLAQVKYVVELARAIATHPAVHRVDLLTRLVKDSKVGHAVKYRSAKGRQNPDMCYAKEAFGGFWRRNAHVCCY